MALIPLHPLGTAKTLFQKRTQRKISEQVKLFDQLSLAAERLGLKKGLLIFAWESANLGSKNSDPFFLEQALLTLALLLAEERGSSRLCTNSPHVGLLPFLEEICAIWPSGTVAEKDTAAEEARAFPFTNPDQLSKRIRLYLEHELEKSPLVAKTTEEYRPFIWDKQTQTLTSQRLFSLEERFVKRLLELISRCPKSSPTAALSDFQDVFEKPARLTSEQRQAVCQATSRPLTVISGGPGTGKTSIVVAILRCLFRMGFPMEQIALVAPTGKAANRMEESVRKSLAHLSDGHPDAKLLGTLPKPATLHRLLGYSPMLDSFAHHENNPLEQKCVIVDEASMVDLALMESLTRALPDDARLILLGDADQLPSVDSGAVLKDLVYSGTGNPVEKFVCRLTESFRMDPKDPLGRNIYVVSQKINAGKAREIFAATDLFDEYASRVSTTKELKHEKVECVSAPLGEFLTCWFERHIGQKSLRSWLSSPLTETGNGFSGEQEEAIRRVFAVYEGARLLCSTRIKERGTETVNKILHEHMERFLGRSTKKFLPGEPIMMLQNDYTKEIFNGDQGIVVEVQNMQNEETRLMAVFPKNERLAVFPLESLKHQVELSYAITIHKSQGSEFQSVALILPQSDSSANTRELLYTGLTRAKKSVILFGEEAILQAGVERKLERQSGIAYLLQGQGIRRKKTVSPREQTP